MMLSIRGLYQILAYVYEIINAYSIKSLMVVPFMKDVYKRQALEAAPGVTVKDDAQNYVYPMPLESAGKDDVYVRCV